MALSRVKVVNVSSPECAEAPFVLLAALGSDGKPYALIVDEATGQFPVSTTGGAVAVTIKNTAYLAYSTTNVTTGAWVQLIASTSDIIKTWDVFSGTGETMELGVGAPGAEVRFALVAPGGGASFAHQLSAGARIAIRAVSGTANAGQLVLNAWG